MEMGKRANGQGAVYLRGDGRWEGQLRLPAGGRKSVYARTRRDLLRKLRVRVHDLRHTTASVLLEIGIHPKVVQDLLGHSTIAVPMDTYSHVAPGLHLEAIQKLDLLLSPACHRDDTLQSIVQ